MKWRIKNPAPPGNAQWGDFHFANSLADHLRLLGQQVETDYKGQWDRGGDEDVVLLLRGLYPYVPRGNACHIMWLISHPERVTLEEYNQYQLVCSASHSHTASLAGKIETPLVTLLQCTDSRRFYLPAGGPRKGLVFVGNTRGTHRPGVVWCAESTPDLQVWGSGWNGRIPERNQAGSYLDNARLGQCYGRASLVLNDHWPVMKQQGFINNRCFDALARGTPLLCDEHPALAQLFPDAVLFYEDQAQLLAHLACLKEPQPKLQEAARAAATHIAKHFTFAARARTLLTLASIHLKQRRAKPALACGAVR